MSRPSVLVAVLVLGVLAALFAWVVADKLEWQETEVEAPPSARAAADPYLALRRVLERVDVPVREVASVRSLPDRTGTVLLVGPRDPDPEAARALLSWAAGGGHLVLEPSVLANPGEGAGPAPGSLGPPSDGCAPLLEPVVQPLEACVPVVRSGGELRIDRGAFEGTVEVELDGASRELALHSPWLGGLGDPLGRAAERIGTGEGRALALRYTVGDGSVTLLADTRWMANDELGDADHAELAWAVLRPDDRELVGLGILRELETAPWLVALLRDAWMIALTLAVAIAAWVWMRAVRQVPVTAPRRADRRELGEHMAASGRFLWHVGYGTDLLDAARRALPPEPIPALARRVGLDPDRLAAACADRSITDEHDFRESIETLRRAIARPDLSQPEET